MSDQSTVSPEAKTLDPRSVLASTALALGAARDTLASWKEKADEATAAFKAEHAKTFELVKAAAESVLSLEATVKALILDDFTKNGDKEPIAGLKIREESMVTVQYDRATAEAWCREKKLFLIDQVDLGAFEAMVVGSPQTAPFATVTTTKIPRPTIAKDLEATLVAIREAVAHAPAVQS